MMTINDPQLKSHVERAIGLMTRLPEDLRPICGLLDGCYYSGLVEGAECPQAREAEELLAFNRVASRIAAMVSEVRQRHESIGA